MIVADRVAGSVDLVLRVSAGKMQDKGWSVTLVCNLRRPSVAANHVVGLGDELGRPPTPPDTPPLVA